MEARSFTSCTNRLPAKRPRGVSGEGRPGRITGAQRKQLPSSLGHLGAQAPWLARTGHTLYTRTVISPDHLKDHCTRVFSLILKTGAGHISCSRLPLIPTIAGLDQFLVCTLRSQPIQATDGGHIVILAPDCDSWYVYSIWIFS